MVWGAVVFIPVPDKGITKGLYQGRITLAAGSEAQTLDFQNAEPSLYFI